MGYWYHAAKVKEILKIRSSQSKIKHVKNLFGCGINKKFNTLTTWNYLLFFFAVSWLALLLLLFYFAVFFLRDIKLCHRCYPQMDPE